MWFIRFQEQAVKNVQNGYIGNDPGVRVWTFSSALMFSLTIFTTIGKHFSQYTAPDKFLDQVTGT